MTSPRRRRGPRPAQPAASFTSHPQPSEEDLLELRDSPFEELERPDGWPLRPPEYVIVIAASDWYKEHFPATSANLSDALNTGHDRHRAAEPDLEAEP